jgi:prolyl-tRNA synthetase
MGKDDRRAVSSAKRTVVEPFQKTARSSHRSPILPVVLARMPPPSIPVFVDHPGTVAPVNATVLDENGKAVTMSMGCYGLGVSRLVGAVIEQNHDDNGIVWPEAIAPFSVIIIPINAHQSAAVNEASELLYSNLQSAGVEVLIDDREGIRPGAKFADAELIGIPHRVVIGDRGLAKGVVEYTHRRTGENKDVSLDDILALLTPDLLTKAP